ncbi:hypothetical protein HanRHA438_Chr15g0693871 [Helianthus annuus]|uniref:Uncharacterized protein n=1 Tax=Helianthus annuus TaxID=4232 RepID=A0A9K3DZP5_HELAN|nr:hypothetical protein HanXRQr2_Chr15g0681711 [Helianthus annuus]KAJ0830293.1 hypothetical protein HanPSC8_Chr15g0653681 [Helianthus annuus]KAJ0843673.1 hypothetical protein HanRHA438_Chr15g0693871 [Helianthus annuus]
MRKRERRDGCELKWVCVQCITTTPSPPQHPPPLYLHRHHHSAMENWIKWRRRCWVRLVMVRFEPGIILQDFPCSESAIRPDLLSCDSCGEHLCLVAQSGNQAYRLLCFSKSHSAMSVSDGSVVGMVVVRWRGWWWCGGGDGGGAVMEGGGGGWISRERECAE